MSNIAIIPARGGSKRIPRKNVRPFLGKPVIQYSIEVALASNLFDEIMVSTDDDEIASISLSAGAKVPFIRSENNANDHSTLSEVLLEVLENYGKQQRYFKNACLILPTAPLVRKENIISAFNLLETKSEFAVVIPVVMFSYPIQRALYMTELEGLKMLQPEYKNSRSQDLSASYHDSGQFYWIKTSHFLREKNIFMEHMGAIELDGSEVQDIDTYTDWKLAEIKYQLMIKNK